VILVDSSVWIDYFAGTATPATDRLDALLGETPVAIGDLMLTEVLQGFRRDRDFTRARALLMDLPILTLGGPAIALRAAEHYRQLRALGLTVRGTVDALIAAYCIEHDLPLLHADRDFLHFEQHLGLRSARPGD
jgi:predicted nucleic acid-binding protein